jgi:hypothetical protein
MQFSGIGFKASLFIFPGLIGDFPLSTSKRTQVTVIPLERKRERKYGFPILSLTTALKMNL